MRQKYCGENACGKDIYSKNAYGKSTQDTSGHTYNTLESIHCLSEIEALPATYVLSGSPNLI